MQELAETPDFEHTEPLSEVLLLLLVIVMLKLVQAFLVSTRLLASLKASFNVASFDSGR